MTSLTVMTWNVENLFKPPQNAAPARKRQYADKLVLLAEVINHHAPDIVALQELGSGEALGDLQRRAGNDYPVRRIGREDGRGIQVGMLSRVAFDEFEHIVEIPDDAQTALANDERTVVSSMGRGALRVRVTTEDGIAVDVITAHLKSKLLTFCGPRGGTRFDTDDEAERARAAQIALQRRSAEAATLRLRANDLLEAGGAVILLGDFNDVPEAATSQILVGPGDSQPPSRAFHTADQRDTVRLFNLAGLIAEDRRFSRVHKGRGELLDQIFASEALFPRPEDGRPRRLPEVDSDVDFADGLGSIGDDPRARAELAPDHAPVVATFEL